jgi:uncharacterized protein (TIGR02996 family)
MPNVEALAFLSRIREQPEDDGPRLIFADWLDEHGDWRGEFIRVQCALARMPNDDERRGGLEQREQALLEGRQPHWPANLNGLVSDWTFRRGLVEAVSVDSSAFLERGGEIFEHGPIRRVRFLEAARCFPQLVDSPLLGRIPQIDLIGNSLGNGGVNLLARARHLGRLELLHLGFNDLTDQGLRALAAISHLDQLHELYLDDNRQLGTPGIRALADSPYLGRLRLLDLSGNGLTEPALRVLINGESLQQLDALLLASNQIGDGGVEGLARSNLFKRMLCRSPALDLSRNNIGPVGARALADSPLIEPLEALDLSLNAIGDVGLSSLAQSPHLRNLKRLVVRECRIGDDGVLALARSRVPETLTHIDLTGNFITSDSIRALDEATAAFDWRRKIDVKADAGLHLRRRGASARDGPAL